jgi:uncharacterized protein
MTNFIPLFPLQIIAYPGEPLNLHIFEPRYKQLVHDCYSLQKPFGLSPVIDGKVQEYGTALIIKSVNKVYDDGSMDIKTEGLAVYRLLEAIQSIPEKLYAGGIVTYEENDLMVSQAIQTKVMKQLRNFHQSLQVEKDYHKAEADITSYDIAHHLGLSLLEEYQLLSYFKENQRLEFISRYLLTKTPAANEQKEIVDRIKLNGHFRNLSLEDFNLQ